ncbi:MAG: hypothetical protein JO021_11885 [Alphaproteobacteria bacterium]|nr:hypothetical protein [Alphaproteobacteria bacterium]
MSALAHYLESDGIPTVAISLVRPQTENTRPPRALWVPFELGRPFGPPNDAAFQTRVVTRALRLLERRDGPVLLEDFPDDDPRERPDPAWQAPFVAAGLDSAPDALAARLVAEVPTLAARYAQITAQRGRTTVGLSGFLPEQAARWIADYLRGAPPPAPNAQTSSVLALRFAADDLKAYYTEAACAGSAPSSKQLGDWLWQQTALGAALQSLRRTHLASADERLKTVATMFLVPGARAG